MNDPENQPTKQIADVKSGMVTYVNHLPKGMSKGQPPGDFDSTPRSAPIVEPTAGVQIKGRLVAQNIQHGDAYYMVIDTADGKVAAKAAHEMNVDFNQHPYIRLDGVTTARHDQQGANAWLCFSSVDGKLWLPSGQQMSQFEEQRTEPASRWIAEIEAQLPALEAEKKRLDAEGTDLWLKLDLINYFDSKPLTLELAMVHANINKSGPDYTGGLYIVMHPEMTKHKNAPEVKVPHDRIEAMVANNPSLQRELLQDAKALLQEDRSVRERLAECERMVGEIDEALAEAPGLIEQLRPLGDTRVTMERSTIQRYRRCQIPRPTEELPPLEKVQQLQGPRIRI